MILYSIHSVYDFVTMVDEVVSVSEILKHSYHIAELPVGSDGLYAGINVIDGSALTHLRLKSKLRNHVFVPLPKHLWFDPAVLTDEQKGAIAEYVTSTKHTVEVATYKNKHITTVMFTGA